MFSLRTILCVAMLFIATSGETFNTTKVILTTIADFYSNSQKPLTNIVPVEDQSQPINVQLTMFLYSVDDFDAVTGQVEITGSIYLEWKDETKASSIANYGFSVAEGFSIFISPERIWTPTVVLLNAVDTVKNVGDPAYKVRYQVSDGRVMWHSRAIIKASCTPDVTYYPFDRQECFFVYTAWGYNTDEVVLEGGQSDWYLCDYTPNAVWALVETKAETYIKNDQYYIKFTFTIERQPLFFVINVIFPILLLGFLNGFVFLLPAESGERVGFCITCFLTLVFMLQTVMSLLPQTADPMSIFCFYVVVMMIMSIVSSIVTVVILRLYFKPETDPVPNFLKKFIRVVTFMWCKPLFRKLAKKCKKQPAEPEDSSLSVDSTDANSTCGVSGDSGVQTDDDLTSSAASDNTREHTINYVESQETPREQTTDGLHRTSSSVSIGIGENSTKTHITDHFRREATSTSMVKFEIENSDVISRTLSADGTVNSADDKSEQNDDDVVWSDVGRALDMFFFIVFIATQGTLAVVFLVPLATGAKSS